RDVGPPATAPTTPATAAAAEAAATTTAEATPASASHPDTTSTSSTETAAAHARPPTLGRQVRGPPGPDIPEGVVAPPTASAGPVPAPRWTGRRAVALPSTAISGAWTVAAVSQVGAIATARPEHLVAAAAAKVHPLIVSGPDIVVAELLANIRVVVPHALAVL